MTLMSLSLLTIFMISRSNEQLHQELEYTLLNPDCHNWWISKMQSDTLEIRYAIKFCFKLGKKSTEMYEMPQTAGSLWGIMRGVGGVRKSIHNCWLAKGLGLGLLCWGFKGVQKEIPWEEASTLEIGSVAFLAGQCTSPQLHPCHRLFDRDGHQDSSSAPPPIVQILLPVTFGYSLSSEAVVMRQLRRWKRLWRRSLTRSHKRTSMGPSRSCWNGTTSAMQPEELTPKGSRVSCVYYQ